MTGATGMRETGGATPGAALELRGVTFRYPAVRRPALEAGDLRVDAGEIVGLVGPNEAGKSTLCLVAAGLAPASTGGELTGDVRIGGTSLRGLRPWEIASLAGIVFAEPATQLSGVAGSVFEEVALGPVNLGLPRDESIARTTAALARLRLQELGGRHPERLSGGQQQLVAIASMVAMTPRVLVLDEPVAELDEDGRRLVGEALRSLAEGGTAVLVAEHDTDFLDAICRRTISIDGGRLAGVAA